MPVHQALRFFILASSSCRSSPTGSTRLFHAADFAFGLRDTFLRFASGIRWEPRWDFASFVGAILPIRRTFCSDIISGDTRCRETELRERPECEQSRSLYTVFIPLNKRGQKKRCNPREPTATGCYALDIQSPLPWLPATINMHWEKYVYTNKAKINIDKSRIFISTWSLLSLRFGSRGQSRARASSHHYLTVINSLPSLGVPPRDNYISWEM